MYHKSFRVLVWIGEGRSVAEAAGLIQLMVGIRWKASIRDAVLYFGRLCVGPRYEAEGESLNAFLEFLDHPWFEDADNFAKIMNKGQVTFLMSNTPYMAQYMSFVGDILAACNPNDILKAITLSDRAIRWPPAGLDQLIALARLRLHQGQI